MPNFRPKPVLQPGCSSDESPPEDPFTSPTTSTKTSDDTQSYDDDDKGLRINFKVWTGI